MSCSHGSRASTMISATITAGAATRRRRGPSDGLGRARRREGPDTPSYASCNRMAVIAPTPMRSLGQRLARFLVSGLIVQAVYAASMALLLVLLGVQEQAGLAIS